MPNYLTNPNRRVVFIAAVFCFILISISGLSAQAQDSLKDTEVRRNYERASDLIKSAKHEASKGRYDQAIDFATRALEYSANKESALFERAKIYTAKKDYEKAVSDFTECIKLGEHQEYFYSGRANVYGLMKKYGEAVSDLTEVIRLNPKSLSAYESRANAYYQLKLYDEAINDITEVIADDRKAKHYQLRAASFRELKDYENAMMDFNHAIELSPKSAELYYDRGKTYFLMGNFDDALKDAKQALYNNPALIEAKDLEKEAAQKGNEKAQGKIPEKQDLR